MLYFFYGDDSKKKRGAYEKLIESLSPSDDALFFISDIDFEEGVLEEHIGGSSLFSSRQVVLLENVFESQEAEQYIIERLKAIAESPNVFIFIEHTVSKKILTKLEKVSEKVELFKLSKASPKKAFNIFSLTDAFGRRDRKKTWILYRQALNSGIVHEEIPNILFWHIKTMLLVKGKSNTAASIKNTGLHPFVFKKSLSFSSNFTDSELRALSSKLTSLHHEGRRGRDLAADLERFILSI